MPGKRIEDLRAIVAQATARDEELRRELETLAADLLKELGGEAAPVWAEIKAGDGERQLDERFVMGAERWLHGDLVVEVTPEQKLVVRLMIRTADKGTHEVGLQKAPSQTVVIDPPDEKHRAEAHKKLFDRIFGFLERQLRERVALPAA